MTADPGFGIYIHWPFCASKCPYCDFNSHVAQSPIDEADFLAAYKVELSHWAQETRYHTVDTIFFGGGTPSLMSPTLVEGILAEIAKHWRLAADVEISLEANPQSVDAKNFEGFAQAGVNRVSIGVQSFDDAALERLGRLHRSKEARAAIEIAKATFERFSFDLIYARPQQSLDDWQEELDQALKFEPTHLSLYQLTIEPDTPYMALHKAGKLRLPEEAMAVDFYKIAQKTCSIAGLDCYEISNHAKPGFEARHNLLYWRYGDFLGIGPGAHGRVMTSQGRMASFVERMPAQWLNLVQQKSHGLTLFEEIDLSTQAMEFILMGMRLAEGISLRELETRMGHSIQNSAIEALMDEGVLDSKKDKNDQFIKTTDAGRLVLNYVTGKLTDGLVQV